jgi:acetolactate synthase-1/2/3 large subunit
MTDESNGAAHLAGMLRAYGVDHVFFIDAVLRRTLIEMESLDITRVMAHSEKAAAYMADGYARVSGKPGICMAQSVGAANLAAGLQDAFLGKVPIIALTGRKAPLYQHRNSYQELIHAPLFDAVTKFKANVDVVEQLPILLAQAFREATAGSPRPVHLDLAGLQGEIIEQATIREAIVVQANFMQAPALRPPPEQGAIAAAANRIDRARRPLIVCGSGAVQAGAHRAVLALAEQLDCPVATTTGGRGIVPTNHRLSLGVIGSYSAPYANQVASEADLVIYVACTTSDQATHNWSVPKRHVPVIQVDIDPVELGRNYPDTVAVLADPVLALQALVAMTPTAKDSSWARHAIAARDAWRNTMRDAIASPARPIRPERLCATLSDVLPEDAILVSDTGYSAIWTATMVELTSPRQTYLRAAGSLGWSFPAALGAKCAAPYRPVIGFCGDGAFYYHLPELETALRKNIAVTMIVNNNSAFAQGRATIRKLYGNRPGDFDDINAFRRTDFAAIARSFGAFGVRVEDPAAIGPAIREAMASGIVAVVDVVTDPETRAPEAWTPAP